MPKILIADDMPYIRLLLEECLEDIVEKGAELIFAVNGKEALELIVREQPELVFLDVMMPQMTGYDVCKTVKKDLGLNGVYIVMLTARGQELDIQKGNIVGADCFISKPFKPIEVIEVAEKILKL